MIALRPAVLLLALVWLAAPPGCAHEPDEHSPGDQFFSGTVEAISDDAITVVRSVLGKTPVTHTFHITADTEIEGSLKVGVRVTVRYVSGEEGDRAVQIIVRSAGQKEAA